MVKCNSYHEIVSKRKPTAFERGFYLAKTGEYPAEVIETKGYCYGTKDCEECECGGDRRKCYFYPENRKPENVAKYEKEHAPKFGEWISVEDELPPKRQEVLVCDKCGSIGIDWQSDTSRYIGSWFIHLNNVITHWMPLPEPPKKSEG